MFEKPGRSVSVPEVLSGYEFTDFYRAGLMSRPPTIDGKVDPEEWAEAVGFAGLTWESRLAGRRAAGWVGATRTHLYFALVTEMPPPPAELVANVNMDTSAVIWDDCMEVWIDSDPHATPGLAYQALINPLGRIAYQTHPRGDLPAERTYGWKGNYRIATGRHGGMWHVEIEVPLGSVAPGPDVTDGVWSFNLCRNWKQAWAFSDATGGEYNPRQDSFYTFSADGDVSVQVREEGSPLLRQIHPVMSLLNTSAKPRRVRGQFYLRRDKMPEVAVNETLTIAPGQSAEVRLNCDDEVSDGFELFCRAADAETGEVCYSRYLRWQRSDGPHWDCQKEPPPPVDFRFAYYPYRRKLRVEGDIRHLPAEAKLEALAFAIRPARPDPGCHALASADSPLADGDWACPTEHAHAEDGKGVAPEAAIQLQMPAGEFVDGLCERELSLDLEGEFEIACQARGAGVPAGPVVKRFHRTRYEWEHNTLGTGRAVYEPFQPVRADGQTVKVALRDYRIGGVGLPEQISAESVERIATKDILAGPMTYRAVVNGQAVEATDAKCSFESVEDYQAVVKSSFSLGTVRATAAATMECDGMMRVELSLPAAPGVTVESLDLEIPLADQAVSLIHAMIDCVRYSILTGKVPAGQGVVWDATKLEPVGFPPNFCTYLWLGDPNRGLSWFAENDRGWSWDGSKPNLSLDRRGDRLILRVHLFNTPAELGEPRTITFGLQASPVKPRMPDWRYRYWTRDYSIVGCDQHWFAQGCCSSVYPAQHDMKLWQWVRQANAKAFTEEQYREAFDYFLQYVERYGESCVKEYAECAHETLCHREGKTLVFYYDRSSSPVIEEYQTFLDEWGMGQWGTFRGSDSRHEIKIVPSESYLDFAAWWYARSFEVAGNTGIYVDNNYFVPSLNLEMTSAFRRPDGSIMPSSGMWGLRELARRQFQLLGERGMYPWTMTHMTTAEILPVNSFYTVQYDWELKHSEGDVHTRFSRDYLLAVSTGDHLGAMPMVLHEQGRLVGDEWTSRTWMGVCLVHELVIDHYVWHGYIPPANPVFDLFRKPVIEISQRPGLVVWRYWEERPQPIAADDADLPTVVYAVPGEEALFVITNYAMEPRTARVRIDLAGLGLAGKPAKAVNIETGEEADVSAGRLEFEVPSHDVAEFRILPS